MKNFEIKIELKTDKDLNIEELCNLEVTLENVLNRFGHQQRAGDFDLEIRVGDIYKEGFWKYGFYPTSDLAKTIICEEE